MEMTTGTLSNTSQQSLYGYSGSAPVGYSPVRKIRPTVPTPHSTNAFLTALGPKALRELTPYLRPVTLTKNQYIYDEGDRLQTIYFPETAVVSEFKGLEDGRIVELSMTGRDGIIGLSALVAGTMTAENLTQVSQPGVAKKMDAEVFSKLLRHSDELRKSVSRPLNSYVRQITQKCVCNMFHPIRDRFCTWLLMLDDRLDHSTFRLTQEQMARIMGVYRPSVTCVAQELRNEHLISYTRGGISVADRRGLERAACECYTASAVH